jgi:hypothetical protein
MDGSRFDRLMRELLGGGSRRGLLRLSASLPLFGGLAALLDVDESDARRRKRRKRQRKRRRKQCNARSKERTCAGKCGPVKNNCQKTVDCGSCSCNPPCPDCQRCNESTGACEPDPAQLGNACRDGAPGCCGAPGVCTDPQSDSDHCGACGNACAAASEICDSGACQPCDVCATCTQTTVQGAINAASDGDTIRICAGTYSRSGTAEVANIDGKDLTLIGAGAGSGGTIFDGGQDDTESAVVDFSQSTSELQKLSITGASGWPAIGMANGTLTLSDVTVTGNTIYGNTGGAIFNIGGTLILNAGSSVTGNASESDLGGGGILTDGGSVTMNAGSRVTGNVATRGSGGGIYIIQGSVTLNAGSHVTGNTAAITGGGIYNNDGTVTVNPGSELNDNSAPPGNPNDCVNDGGGTGCP